MEQNTTTPDFATDLTEQIEAFVNGIQTIGTAVIIALVVGFALMAFRAYAATKTTASRPRR